MNKKELFILTLIIGLIFGATIAYFAYKMDKAELMSKNLTVHQQSQYQIYSVDIPKNVNFAGEPVPVHQPDILKRLDEEIHRNTFYHSSTIVTIKRANQYFPMISKILKGYGIPDDFKYVAVAESNLQNVTSPAGAVGFWQFMKPTGREFGLEISALTDDYGQPVIDERMHVEKATHAACKYLKSMYKELGNWTNVAASYNRGLNAFKKAQKKQRVTSYYDLRLNRETSHYVFRIVALKEIMNKPEKYGFHIPKLQRYSNEPYDEVRVDTSINDLVTFAHQFELTYKSFRLANPWLTSNKLPNEEGNSYFIKIPKYRDLNDEMPASDSTYSDSVETEILDIDSVAEPLTEESTAVDSI